LTYSGKSTFKLRTNNLADQKLNICKKPLPKKAAKTKNKG